MKKQYLLIISVIFITSLSFAQEFSVGARGGLNYYSIGDINSRGGSIQSGLADVLYSPNKEMGTQFGAFLNVEFGKLYVRGEINFVSNNNNYDFPNKVSKWKASKTNIPILVGYKVFDPISIYAGIGFDVINKVSLDGVQETSFSDGGPDLEKTSTNVTVGIMVEFKRFGLDLRYEPGSKETQEELLDIDNGKYGVNLADLRSYKPSQLSLSLNIYLFRTNSSDIGGLFTNLFRSDKCHCPY